MSLLKTNEIQVFNGTTVTITATTAEVSADLNVGADLDVTGALTLGTALAIAEGGTGATDAATARTNLDVDQAGTDNSTDVSLVTTSHDYLSIAGQAITLGPIDLAADVTGTLATSNGGTGVTSLGSLDAADLGSGAAADGYVLTADGSGGTAWEAKAPIDLLSSGASIRKSDGTTAVLSESGGTATLNNTNIGSAVVFPAGHIVQSVIPATIGNIVTTAIINQSPPAGFGDVINQITIQSGNGVLIFLHVGIQINAGGNCFGGLHICEGTVSSVGTILASDQPGSGETINRVFYSNLWAYDPSPASTTPSYVFALGKGSVATTSQQLYINNATNFYCYLYEIQQ